MKKQHINTLKPSELNMDALENAVRDLRIARRAVLTLEEGREDLKKRADELKVEIQEALDKGDLDGITKANTELKRITSKLDEDPAIREKAFKDALERFTLFVETNQDISEVDETEEPINELKEAA